MAQRRPEDLNSNRDSHETQPQSLPIPVADLTTDIMRELLVKNQVNTPLMHEAVYQEHGPIVWLKLPVHPRKPLAESADSYKELFINQPSLTRDILVDKTRSMQSSAYLGEVGRLLGHGNFTTEIGKETDRHYMLNGEEKTGSSRHSIDQAFQPHRTDKLTTGMGHIVRSAFDQWDTERDAAGKESDAPVVLNWSTTSRVYTREMTATLLLGLEPGKVSEMDGFSLLLKKNIGKFLTTGETTHPQDPILVETRSKPDKQLTAVLKSKLQPITEETDPSPLYILKETDDRSMAYMILKEQSMLNNGVITTDLIDEARAGLIGIYLAGGDTTSLWTSWAIYELSKNPTWQHDMQAEIDTVVGDQPITSELLGQLPLTLSFMREILRKYTPQWRFARKTAEDFSLENPNGQGEFAIPAETNIVIDAQVLHHTEWGVDFFTEKNFPGSSPEERIELAQIFTHLDTIDPRRFINGQLYKKYIDQFLVLAFGEGSKICPARHFAQAEAMTIMIEALRRYDFSLANPEESISPVFAAATLMNKDLLVRTQSRVKKE